MAAGEQSWSSILNNIVSNVQEIIRSEFRLAKSEVKEESQAAAKAAIPIVSGIALALYALGFLLLCAVYALTLAVAPWLAALIVGVVLALVALVTVSIGRNKLRRVPKPVKTIQSVKETVQWVKNQGS